MFESLTYLNSMDISLMYFYLFLLGVAIVKNKSYVYQLPIMALTICILIDMGTTSHGLFDMVIMFIMLLIPMFNIVINTITNKDDTIEKL